MPGNVAVLRLAQLALVAVISASCLGQGQAQAAALPEINVSGQKIVDQLLHLATYSDDPNPAVTRILFTGGMQHLLAARARPFRAHPPYFPNPMQPTTSRGAPT